MNDGLIVILSYPDTVVRPAYSEFSSKIWPFFGVGGKDAVQAGHAALLLVHKKTGEIDYFDFGRYITSYGFGRVRSKITDPELIVPVKAVFKEDDFLNLQDVLLWLDKYPEKTHGEGRLVAGVNDAIDYRSAKKYILNLSDKKEVPYGIRVKEGSNCARFVTDTIISACSDKKVVLKLKTSNLFTPSPVGNVIKGTTDAVMYAVVNQKVSEYTNTSLLKEYKECFFKKIDRQPNVIGTELPNIELFELEKGTWLGGIGSGAWFGLEFTKENNYTISRYTAKGEKDFEGCFVLKSAGFDVDKNYEFIHPTNCKEAFVKQNGMVYSFKLISLK